MFASQEFLPPSVFARLIDARIHDPDLPFRTARERVRREHLAPAGRLTLVAGHEAFADRRDHLARILRVLMTDAVDGVVAAMDVLEDLLSIDGFIRAKRGLPLLEGKLLIASLNRGGLAGAGWPLNDAITGATPAACAYWSLDAVHLVLRIAEEDGGSIHSMVECNQAITQANSLRLPAILEVLPVTRGPAGWTLVQTREAIARAAHVASSLGDSSRFLWLNLPFCESFDTVAQSTSLPILILGTEFTGQTESLLYQLAASQTRSPNVRGALLGRNTLSPGDDDPLAIATAAGRIVHRGWSVEEAIQALSLQPRPEMDRITRYL